MTTDTAIFIAVGFLAVGMAVLGGHVATTHKWSRRGFYAMGALSAALIMWQGYRTQYAQEISAAATTAADQDFRWFVLKQEQQTRDAIGKQRMFREVQPELARLKFYFGRPLADKRVINAPLVLGVVTIEFSVIVSGNVGAQHGALWVACSGCQFEHLPAGWSYSDNTGKPDVVNGGEFSNVYVGVTLPPMKLDIVPPYGSKSFDLGFMYACQNCPGLDLKKAQTLTVNTVTQ